MSETIEKLKRAGAMPPRELAYRLREKAHTNVDRIRLANGGPLDRLEIRFKQYLAGLPARRFYRGTQEDLEPLMKAAFPHWIDRTVEEAERLCRHSVDLLGYGPVQLGPKIDWHWDPVHGCGWEREYWADYHPTNDPLGRDIKIVHELNRHQHLPRLAKAWALTGEERFAREAVDQLNSWIEQNPPGLGVNWQSSLEIGIRLTSWLWTVFLLLPSCSFDEQSAQRIGESLFAQLDHVARYTSLFSSPNTHLIGEATALFMAGMIFRGLKSADTWFESGVALLTREIEKQVSPDGVYGELSSYYHCYALDFYLQVLVLAAQNQFRMARPVRHCVRSMLQFLMHLTRPDGSIPALGDDDGGRALALAGRDYRSFRDGLCVGAVLYRHEGFKHQAGGFCEEALWLLGMDAWEAYRQMKGMPPRDSGGNFHAGGYWVRRSGWGPLDSHLVFDCGGLGILAGGHAHADALSFTLFSGGRDLLIDPGTFVYNGAPEWRRYFRSTRAHNTVCVDGLDQAGQGGTFRWQSKLHSQVTGQYSMPDIDYLEGEHDGYASRGVVHRRRLLHLRPECWIVVDDFRGTGEHRFELRYHFAPDVNLTRLEHHEAGVTVCSESSGARLSLFGSRPLGSEILSGWASRGYGDRRPCTVLAASLASPAPAAAMTFIQTSGTEGSEVRRLNLQSGEGVACSWRRREFEDIAVVATSDHPMSVAGFQLRGEFFWLRLEAGVLKQVLAIRALSLKEGRTTLFMRSEPGPYYAVMDSEGNEETICAGSVGS